MQDIIFIHGIKTKTLIGIERHERLGMQDICIDLDLYTDIKKAAVTEDVTATLNYAAVSDFVDDFSKKQKTKLLETFAENLIAALFNYCDAEAIRLKLTKPGAIMHTRDVGILIHRQRNT